MVELLEYSLVFLASSMLVGFSMAIASSYQGASQAIEARAALSSLSGAAWEAVEHGGSNVTLSLTNSTITCAGGVLTLTSGSFTGREDLPARCGFSFVGLGGWHTFGFTFDSGRLELTVG